jgi:uncharacterized membrane protein YbaN (DUF454 family)
MMWNWVVAQLETPGTSFGVKENNKRIECSPIDSASQKVKSNPLSTFWPLDSKVLSGPPIGCRPCTICFPSIPCTPLSVLRTHCFARHNKILIFAWIGRKTCPEIVTHVSSSFAHSKGTDRYSLLVLLLWSVMAFGMAHLWSKQILNTN